MNIEAKCKNCRFCKEMTGPYDTDNYYICMRGSLAITVKPEEKCAHIVEGFEPTESLLRELWRSQQRFTPSDYINKDETSMDDYKYHGLFLTDDSRNKLMQYIWENDKTYCVDKRVIPLYIDHMTLLHYPMAEEHPTLERRVEA